MFRSQPCKDLGRRAAYAKALRWDCTEGNAGGVGRPPACLECGRRHTGEEPETVRTRVLKYTSQATEGVWEV